MAELVLDCPHCNTERIGFECGGDYLIRRRQADLIGTWNTLFVCRKCREGVVVKVRGKAGSKSPNTYAGELRTQGFDVLGVHPKRQLPPVPEHLRDVIAQDYKEAADSLHRQNFTSAGMMFRKVLQRATTALAAGTKITFTKRDDLKSRIDRLADPQLITPAMRDWAHLIRLEGNDATHDEDEAFEQSEAEQLQAFTELFLIYAFTLPARVKKARGTDADTDA